MSLASNKLIELITIHKNLLKKVYDSSLEIAKLDLDNDYELLEQIIDMREKLFSRLTSIYSQIEEHSVDISKETFLQLYKLNDNYIEKILTIDNENSNRIEKFGKMLNSDKLDMMNKKKALSNYKISNVKKSKFFDRIS